ncbi:MAG: FHA domain-containing protein [Thermodesulfobacteriota bacterium]
MMVTQCIHCASNLNPLSDETQRTSNRPDTLEFMDENPSSCNKWILKFSFPDDPNRSWGVLFDKHEIIVGRRDETEHWYPDVDLSDILPSEKASLISRKHLQLTIQDRHPVIKDMGSVNRVYLNSADNPLDPHRYYPLKMNDVIGLGNVVAFKIKEWKAA